ncbi:MAG TPA: urate oxidase [Actinospica sp.]|jgi:urate oxidase|nr:urate oxidase [Actinospica sp.]
MPIILGENRYGKAETHVVRIAKDSAQHEIKDLTVSVALSGEMADVHLSGDNAAVLPTDTQKNTVFAFAQKYGIETAEHFAILLAQHFVDSQPTIRHARVEVAETQWDRIEPWAGRRGTGEEKQHPHSFVRSGRETRTVVVHCDGERTHVVSGLRDLVVLNSTASEFHGYIRDEFTTLPETRDRVLATAVTAQWRHAESDNAEIRAADFDGEYDVARAALLEAFADTYSLSLQQTLYAMGTRVIDECAGVCEVKLALPNKHHFVVDLSPFGMQNPNETFYAADRPYGLIEGTVQREDAPPAGPAWS